MTTDVLLFTQCFQPCLLPTKRNSLLRLCLLLTSYSQKPCSDFHQFSDHQNFHQILAGTSTNTYQRIPKTRISNKAMPVYFSLKFDTDFYQQTKPITSIKAFQLFSPTIHNAFWWFSNHKLSINTLALTDISESFLKDTMSNKTAYF